MNDTNINTIAERLKPVHLDDEAPNEEKAVQENPEKPEDPKNNREYTFRISHTDGRGTTYEGKFRNRVLTLGDRRRVGVIRARLADGLPPEALDEITNEINFMASHLTVSLQERPDWAKDLLGLDDLGTLQAIFAEVADHEATFLGRRENPENSET